MRLWGENIAEKVKNKLKNERWKPAKRKRETNEVKEESGAFNSNKSQ